MKNQVCNKVMVLHTDRWGELLSQEFKVFCEEKYILREWADPYTPGQNGIVEKKNQIVVKMERSMSKSESIFCGGCSYCSLSAKYFSDKKSYGRTPFVIRKGRKLCIIHTSYALINSQHHKKIWRKIRKMHLLWVLLWIQRF